MYGFYLQIFTSLVNVVGTVYAVLSILKMKPSDIYRAITLDGMDHGDEDRLMQKKQARVGIGLVVLGWVLQVIFGLVNPHDCVYLLDFFGMRLAVGRYMDCGFVPAEQRLDKQYSEYYAKHSDHERTHKDDHSWQEF